MSRFMSFSYSDAALIEMVRDFPPSLKIVIQAPDGSVCLYTFLPVQAIEQSSREPRL